MQLSNHPTAQLSNSAARRRGDAASRAVEGAAGARRDEAYGIRVTQSERFFADIKREEA